MSLVLSMELAMTDLLLASKSPRRRAILEAAGIKFTAVESGYDEDMSLSLPPATMVHTFALGKSDLVARENLGKLVLGADTVVISPDGKIYGKPHTRERAFQMLSELSGKAHTVMTGYALVQYHPLGLISMRYTGVDTARLVFRPLTDQMIWSYVNGDEHRIYAAGGYILTEVMDTFVERVEGDVNCIMGLPINTLLPVLTNLGVPIG